MARPQDMTYCSSGTPPKPLPWGTWFSRALKVFRAHVVVVLCFHDPPSPRGAFAKELRADWPTRAEQRRVQVTAFSEAVFLRLPTQVPPEEFAREWEAQVGTVLRLKLHRGTKRLADGTADALAIVMAAQLPAPPKRARVQQRAEERVKASSSAQVNAVAVLANPPGKPVHHEEELDGGERAPSVLPEDGVVRSQGPGLLRVIA
jgi:hypothetical protein